MAPNSTELGKEEREEREAAMRSKAVKREDVGLSKAPQAASFLSHYFEV